MGRHKTLTDEERKQYILNWKKEARRKRGLQKQGRKPLSEEEKLISKENRKQREKEWSKQYFEINPQKRLLWAARRRAKIKQLPFNIEEIDVIIPTHCPYLGIELHPHTPNGFDRQHSMSLDRIIPELGYVKGNIEVISHLANTMKNNATPEQLISFAKEILNRYDPNFGLRDDN